MATGDANRAIHAGGRIGFWLVLALMMGAVVYSTAMVVMNWDAINV